MSTSNEMNQSNCDSKSSSKHSLPPQHQQYNYDFLKAVVIQNWRNEIRDAEQIERFIKCNSQVPLQLNMDLLKETLTENPLMWKEMFFNMLFPCIVEHAKEIESGQFQSLFAKFKANNAAVELTRSEIACLLANAFLCKFPHCGNSDENLNFTGLYESAGAFFRNVQQVKKEKIKCILMYFQWFFLQGKPIVGTEKVIYRRNLASPQNWSNSTHAISPMLRVPQQSIFEAHSMAQVDFANRRVGGGVLGNGSLQEEVRFATCPELIVARMFSRKMEDNESIVIENFLQYCKFEGYGDTFKCDGLLPDSYITQVPQTLVAMDALDFSNNSGNLHQEQQYLKKHVERELLKAYAAFSGASNDSIATGNWGGGCFKGDPILKAKIQVIAAAQAGKQLCYMTYDETLASELKSSVGNLTEETVGEAYKDLVKWCNAKSHSFKHKK